MPTPAIPPNDATVADPSWQPLLATPPYPSHHFQFELTASYESCARVADFIVRRHARPSH